MEKNRITLSVLHRNTGIAIPTIKRLQIDPAANPTMTTLLPIANFFNITINQLIGNELLPAEMTGYYEDKRNWLKVPLINWGDALNWPNFEIKKDQPGVLVDIDVGKNPYALMVEDEDWYLISKGSILIINTNISPEHKDYTIVNKHGQFQPTLKQFLIDDGKIFLKPMNQYLPLSQFTKNYKTLGVLIQIRKDIKT